MRLSNAALLTLLSGLLLSEAAPASTSEKSTGLTVSKRETLTQAMTEFEALKLTRAKRSELDTELAAREYAIVTQVLTAIKDTELTPRILKFFVSNEVLKSAAITGVEYVIKSGLLSLKGLLQLLVQSGLITDVLNDVLGNCAVYSSILGIAKDLLVNLLKREDLALDAGVDFDGDLGVLKRDVELLALVERQVPYSHDEAYSLLRRDGLVDGDELLGLLDAVKRGDLEARDVDDIVVNVLESLADSGLALQVVETVLTDGDFVTFAAALVKKLYEDGLILVSALVSAVTQSGLLPALLKELVNFSTLSKIATTALAAFDGECLSAGTNSTSDSTSDSTTTGGSLLGGLLSSLTDGSSSDSDTSSGSTQDTSSDSSGDTSTSTGATSTSSGAGLLGLASSLLGGGGLLSGLFDGDSTSTTAAACLTSALLRRDRVRLY